MKKTTQIFKSIIAVAAATMFVACKKEIDLPQNNLNTNNKVISAGQVVINPLSARTATPKGYAGTSTLGDSTSAGR